MKKRSGWLRFLVGLLFFALLLAPIGGIYAITNLEMEQYQQVAAPAVAQKSYGTPVPVVRMDMKEFITVDGVYVSTERYFMELPELRNVYSARWLIDVGDYIEDGMLLGYTENGTREIYATATGIVREIHLGQTSYLTLESIEDLALRCSVKGDELAVLRRSSLKLSDQNDRPVELLELGKTANADGSVPVLLGLSGGMYGASAEKVKLYTGMVYTKALVAPTECLFHTPEDPEAWYVRLVDENRNALGTQKVQVGFSDGAFTCITGIAEGTLLDSGYASIYGD